MIKRGALELCPVTEVAINNMPTMPIATPAETEPINVIVPMMVRPSFVIVSSTVVHPPRLNMRMLKTKMINSCLASPIADDRRRVDAFALIVVPIISSSCVDVFLKSKESIPEQMCRLAECLGSSPNAKVFCPCYISGFHDQLMCR